LKKPLLTVICLLLALAMLPAVAGCGNKAQLEAKERRASFTDDLGRQVNLEQVPERIVSVSPACTEILFALGLGDKVVGDTEYCDYPEEATQKTKIGTFTTPNLEAIIALDPDLVLATGGVQKDLLDRMEQLGLTVYAVDAKTFDGTVKDIRDVGDITGTSAAAEAIASDMEDRAAAIDRDVAAREAAGEARPRVFYEIFYENNVWTAGSGSVISDLINRAGGVNIADAQAGDYYEFSVESLISENPQVYLVGSGSMSNPGDVNKRSGWDKMDAVENGRLYVISDDLVYRTGPRLIDGLEAIYNAIYQ
jgi:iron complex transport system substrate-binding protein